MEKQAMPPCHRPASKSCCANESIVHDGDDFKAAIKGVMLPVVSVIDMELPHVLLAEVIPSIQFTPSEFFNYDPPLRKTDLTVSLQVFII
jgi:hypothetical protein